MAAVLDRRTTRSSRNATRPRSRDLAIRLSIAGFAVHLLLIFLARTLADPPLLVAAAGHNYLTAISTPFNFILFYEVLTLIAALPASTTRSIASQFEIVSLIFIRDVFRDIGSAGDLVTEHKLTLEYAAFVSGYVGRLPHVLPGGGVPARGPKARMGASLTSLPSRETLRFIAQKRTGSRGSGDAAAGHGRIEPGHRSCIEMASSLTSPGRAHP